MRINDIFNPEEKRTFVVAEIGSNHNQDIHLAYETIDAAYECGADAVKFQSINIDELYLDPDNSVKALHKKIDLEEDWHDKLKNYCDRKGIIFFSTPTYLSSIDILERINITLYKLASAQIGTFPPLVEKVAKTGKPVLLSTGLVTYSELEKAIGIFKKYNNTNFVILHCNSIYPTPYGKVNLKLIPVYQAMFNHPVGFSDHTQDIYIPLAAVSIGASVIEKHFTLSKQLPIPDASISLEPKEFSKMVEGIRAIEHSLQFKERIFLEKEESLFKNQIRYRLILNTPKKTGDSFAEKDFDFKRHPSGVDCMDMKNIVKNMKPKKNIETNSLLTWDLLTGK